LSCEYLDKKNKKKKKRKREKERTNNSPPYWCAASAPGSGRRSLSGCGPPHRPNTPMCPPPETSWESAKSGASGWPPSQEKTTVVIDGCPIGYYVILRKSLTRAILKQNPNAVVTEKLTWPLVLKVTKDDKARVGGLTGTKSVLKMLLCMTSVDAMAKTILEDEKQKAEPQKVEPQEAEPPLAEEP
jgi:hypothetical protein